jgi:predicted AAA+ superfamily ATPase
MGTCRASTSRIGHRDYIEAYVADYLREEVAAEALVRNLPVFSEFLNVAALSDTELVNFATIARDCGVSSHTIKDYFGILEDTLLGRWLPAYTKRPKRRVIAAPKFYFADVGVVNHLGGAGPLCSVARSFTARLSKTGSSTSWLHAMLTKKGSRG